MHSTTLRGLALTAACVMALAAPTALAQTVEKTVNEPTTFAARALWTIEKTADASELTLQCNQTFTVNYEVTVRKVQQVFENHMDGTITVTNTTGGNVTLNDVEDFVRATSNPALEAELEVDCSPAVFPLVMAPGDVLNCTYAGRVYEPSNLALHDRNQATATFAGIGEVHSALVPFAVFVRPDPQLDSCIEVEDDLEGALGTVCFQAGTTHVFNYSGQIGPFGASGVYPVVNTASFFGTDSGPGGAPEIPGSTGSATGEDAVTVTATVVCEGGCTLTQGYWKTHSEFGPAPYDATWGLLANGASTLFLNSAVTWYDLFWMSPSGGNAYIQLAHQFMAASLNVLAGAAPPAGTTLADAQTILTNNLSCLTGGACSNTVKSQMRALATTLDDYNNGETGPGHCSENGSPSANATIGDGSSFALGTPAPNPTTGSSSIRFDVPEASQVILVAYDVMGREVARLADDYYEAGTHEVVFSGANLPAGTYFIRMSAGEFHDVTRVVLAR